MAVRDVRLAAQLIEAGVAVLDADRQLGACDGDKELALVLVPLLAEPRVGDRIRVRMPSGDRTLLVEDVAGARPVLAAKGSGVTGGGLVPRWSVVGRPVAASRRDDVALTTPVRRA